MQQTTLEKSKKKAQVSETSSSSNKVKKKASFLHTLFLILIILVLTSIIALGGIFIFNIAGLKRDIAKALVNFPLIGNVVKPLAENKTPEQIEAEQLELKKRDLNLQMQKNNEKEKQLLSKEKELSQKEIELQSKENELNEKIAQADDKLQSIMEQVQYIEKMDTAKAAQVLLNMNERSAVIQILRNLKKDKAAAIISYMDPLQAAQLLEELDNTKPDLKSNILP
ncbi:hypothetical protein SDC9_160673 [bioreactor metagenome]|uniref:Magnesium transporter MgtE intracellular domain-containing protein n=1 Tax=bioreactor metagenome TaxID=1076179 RepID=A0A645FIJ6_9ZZZZ